MNEVKGAVGYVGRKLSKTELLLALVKKSIKVKYTGINLILADDCIKTRLSIK